MDNTSKSDTIEFEVLCQFCNGTGGGDPTYMERTWHCHRCNGTGYVRTDLGEKVYRLLQHHFKSMLQDAQAK
jgi:DnaJ-class molecular chaperone